MCLICLDYYGLNCVTGCRDPALDRSGYLHAFMEAEALVIFQREYC